MLSYWHDFCPSLYRNVDELQENYYKNAFFLQIIWSTRKNVVTLHRKLMSEIIWGASERLQTY